MPSCPGFAMALNICPKPNLDTAQWLAGECRQFARNRRAGMGSNRRRVHPARHP